MENGAQTVEHSSARVDQAGKALDEILKAVVARFQLDVASLESTSVAPLRWAA